MVQTLSSEGQHNITVRFPLRIYNGSLYKKSVGAQLNFAHKLVNSLPRNQTQLIRDLVCPAIIPPIRETRLEHQKLNGEQNFHSGNTVLKLGHEM